MRGYTAPHSAADTKPRTDRLPVLGYGLGQVRVPWLQAASRQAATIPDLDLLRLPLCATHRTVDPTRSACGAASRAKGLVQGSRIITLRSHSAITPPKPVRKIKDSACESRRYSRKGSKCRARAGALSSRVKPIERSARRASHRLRMRALLVRPARNVRGNNSPRSRGRQRIWQVGIWDG